MALKSKKKQNDGEKKKVGRPKKRYTGRKATKMRLEALEERNLEIQTELPSTVNLSVQEQAMVAESYRVGYNQLLRNRDSTVRGYVPHFLDNDPRNQDWCLIATHNDYNVHTVCRSEGVDITWIGHPFLAPNAAHVRRFLVHWRDPLPFHSTYKELGIQECKPVLRWAYICNGTCSVVPSSKRWKGGTATRAGSDSDSNSDSDATEMSDYEISDNELSENEGSYSDMEELEDDVADRPRRHKCSGKVKLHLEVLANNLDVVNIWQHGEHPNASPDQGLTWSRGLHNEVGYALRLYGVRPFTVMRNLVHSYGFPHDIAGRTPLGSSVSFPQTFPRWRLPTYKQVANIMPAIKRRAQMDRDPFVALQLIAKKHPDKIYFHVPHDKNKPDSESNFTCAVITQFSLESLILHGSHDGVGLDTSWRNKNENRAAVSFLIAVDRQGHLTPGSVLLSANVKSTTIAKYLNLTEKKVVERAEVIVQGQGGLDSIVHPDTQDRIDILEISKQIVKHRQWFIRKWMIDKSASLLSGIQKHDSNALILVCQFHIIQALNRLDGGEGRVPNAPRIPYPIKYEIAKTFRQAQRCRSMDDWPNYKRTFFATLRKIILTSPIEEVPLNQGDEDATAEITNEDTPSRSKLKRSSKKRRKGIHLTESQRFQLFEFLEQYFNDYWFTPRWLAHVTDMGLSDGDTRDGTFYTNNWCESAFQTFDKVFLGLTKNKRLDRLLAIILGDFFDFYEMLPSKEPRIPWDILNSNFEAYTLWDTDKVKRLGGHQYSVSVLSGQKIVNYIVNLTRPDCTNCIDWSQTGKACIHIRAARLFETNGPVSDWEKLELVNQHAAPSKVSRSKKAIQLRRKERQEETLGETAKNRKQRLLLDEPLERELDRMIEELGDDPEYLGQPPHVRSPSPVDTEDAPPCERLKLSELREADGFRSGWSTTGGRPGYIPPMSPWRNKTPQHRTVQFSQTPGKRADPRIHPNSVFTQKVYGQQKTPKHTHSSVHQRSVSKTVRTSSPLNIVVDDNGLTQEDIQISSVDMTRWQNPQYTLRVDEMHVLVEILNACSATLDSRRWYTVSAGKFGDNVLEALTSKQNTEFATRVCHDMSSRKIDTIVFLELTAQKFHWTCWEYSISSTGLVICNGFNSLSSNEYLEAVDRSTHLGILQAYRDITHPHKTDIAMSPLYQSVNTGLQTDDTSCGFWAIFFALLPLIWIPIDCETLRSLPLNQIKFWLGRLWTTYFTDVEGVRGKELSDIYACLAPQSIGLSLPQQDDVVARRSSDRERIHIFNTLSNAITEEEEAKYLARLAEPGFKLVIGHETLDTTQFRRILGIADEGWISEAILNAYFEVFSKDWEFQRGVHGLHPSWHIASTTLTRVMATQPTRESKPFKPESVLRTKASWFPTINIFELRDLILPWHISHPTPHWFLIHIGPRTHTVHVYDSLSPKGLRLWHINACKRVMHFLKYEYLIRYPALEFSAEWELNLRLFQNHKSVLGPTQPDQGSCGIFVILNAESLCTGVIPDKLQLYSSVEIQNMRRKIALRLSREDHIFSEIPYSPKPPSNTDSGARSSLEPPTVIASTSAGIQQSTLDESTPVAKSDPMTELPLWKWELYLNPEDKKYWPGQIFEVDVQRRECLVIISREIIPDGEKDLILVRTGVDIVHDLLNACSAPPDRIAAIRWPAYLDEDFVPEDIREYVRGVPIDWETLITPIKKPLINYLQSRLSEVASTIDGPTTLLPELREDAVIELQHGQANLQDSYAFSARHLCLLDVYDRTIIEHLATWHLSKDFLRAEELNWQQCLGAAILGYIAMGWYLNVSEQEAYELKMKDRLILPRSVAEQAWEPIHRAWRKQSKEPLTFQDLLKPTTWETSHRVLEKSSELMLSGAGQAVDATSSIFITSNNLETDQAAQAQLELEEVPTAEPAFTFEHVPPTHTLPVPQLESTQPPPSTNSKDVSFKIRIPGGRAKRKAATDLEPVGSSLRPGLRPRTK